LFGKWPIFDRTGLGGAGQISRVVEPSEGIMTVPKNDKHKEYASYAKHRLQMAPVAPDQEYRASQREMATERLRLSDVDLHPLKRVK
jgi:hypothetical protein